MAAFNKLPIYIHSIKLSFKNNILYLSLQTCSITSLVKNSLPNLTFLCNTTPLNLMNQAKSFVSLSRLSENTNTNAFLWDSNVPKIFLSKSWRRYYMMSKTLVSILTVLVPSLSLGKPHFNPCKILHWLETNSFTVNPLKCDWAIQETDWIGNWLTPTGLKPWHKKIDGIIQIQKPKNLSQICGFFGAVNHY
ncbi:hypothetical protein ACHAXS_000722 [Conticribra weissflogii]